MKDESQFANGEDDSRRFARFPVPGRARIFSAERSWDTELIDLSLKGMLVARPPDWEPDRRNWRAEVRLDGGILISMAVATVRADDQVVGFRCERIDIDSFARLKRLVELNLGQPALLNRELSALD